MTPTYRNIAALLYLAVHVTPLTAEVSLSGKVANYTSYFTDAEKLRHNRYELHLLQSSTITNQLSTKIEGRFRFEAALYPAYGSYSHISDAVRDDEMTEAEPRQIYLDYLNDYFATKIGLQQIDWVESLSPRTSDVLTPLDLRFAGTGSAKDLIEPVVALLLNHKFVFGSFEWLYIPLPKNHRLAKGRNGYGYYESLLGDASSEDVTVIEEKNEDHISEAEAGVRYLAQAGSFEFTLLAFHGHQRSPALRVTPLDMSQPDKRTITETHPQLNTFGGSIVYAGDALVSRFVTYYEPRRRPSTFFKQSFVETSPANPVTGTPPLFAAVENPEWFERRLKVGLGLDYVFSKHLKLYSEHFLTRQEKYMEGQNKKFASSLKDKRKDSYSNALRLTNESFDHWFLSLDASIVGPDKGRSFTPEISYTYSTYKISTGAQIVQSDTPSSSFEPFKKTDQIYVSLESFFDVTP